MKNTDSRNFPSAKRVRVLKRIKYYRLVRLSSRSFIVNKNHPKPKTTLTHCKLRSNPKVCPQYKTIQINQQLSPLGSHHALLSKI